MDEQIADEQQPTLPHAPWFESNILWSPVTAGIGTLLTVVAAMKHDLRWLLIFAWVCFVVAAWVIAGRFRARWWITTVAAVGIGLAFFWMNAWLRPSSEIAGGAGGMATAPAPKTTIPLPDSVAVEVRRAVTPVEFSFQTSGEKKQKITSSVIPEVIEVEPKPTGVKESDLPEDVPVTGGTIAVLRFGQEGDHGYMLFDTNGLPNGTSVRGRILRYKDLKSPTQKRAGTQAHPSVKSSQAPTGDRNTQAAGAVTAGPCSNIQVGGSNNQASTTCDAVPPTVRWLLIATPQVTENTHPHVSAKIWLDRPYMDAKFAVVCDRPCDAVGNGNVGGYNQVTYGKVPNHPDIAAFVINGPNPFPANTDYLLTVQSQDNNPVNIIAVKTLTITGGEHH